jgi:excisionase family DNA binding protein
MRTSEQEVALYNYRKVPDVASQLDCGRDHVLHLIEAGELDAIDISVGGRPSYRVSQDAIDRFIEARTVRAKT